MYSTPKIKEQRLKGYRSATGGLGKKSDLGTFAMYLIRLTSPLRVVKVYFFACLFVSIRYFKQFKTSFSP